MKGATPILESMSAINLISLFLKNFLNPGVLWALGTALLPVSALAQTAAPDVRGLPTLAPLASTPAR